MRKLHFFKIQFTHPTAVTLQLHILHVTNTMKLTVNYALSPTFQLKLNFLRPLQKSVFQSLETSQEFKI